MVRALLLTLKIGTCDGFFSRSAAFSTPPTEPYLHFYTKKGGESDCPNALCPPGGGGWSGRAEGEDTPCGQMRSGSGHPRVAFFPYV